MKGPHFHFRKLFFTLLGLFLAFSLPARTQDSGVPQDFEITLTSAPNFLHDPLEKESIRIKADGTAWFSARFGGDEPLAEAQGQLTPEDIAAIYRAVQKGDFFELNEAYEDPQIVDGDYAEISVTANGLRHKVKTVNVRLFDFDLISLTVNARVPEDRTVIYNALVDNDYQEIER